MKTHYLAILALAGLGFFANPAMARQTAAEIEHKTCSLCHGPGGITSSELFPQLAGQPAPYIVDQLKAFRDKTRSNQNARRFMWGIAAKLSDEDINNLAAFYASKTAVPLGKISDKAKYEAGKSIFTEGISDKGVPPCMDCHGEKGEGNDTTPRLGGQHESYLKRQLKIFFGKERPAATAMHDVVKGLTQNDIDAIAYYLQAQ